jgi:hypothetical protein
MLASPCAVAGRSIGEDPETCRKWFAGGCSARQAESAVAAGGGRRRSFMGVKPRRVVVESFGAQCWGREGVLLYTEEVRLWLCTEAGREGEVGGEDGPNVMGETIPSPIPPPVGVNGRGVGGRDLVLGVLGSGFSLHDSTLLSLFLWVRFGFSREVREKRYGVRVIGRSLNLPSRWMSNGSRVVAMCAKKAHAVNLCLGLALRLKSWWSTYRLMIENAAPAR